MNDRLVLYRNGDFYVVPARHGFSVYQTHPLGAQRCAQILHGGDIGLTLARTKADHLAENAEHNSPLTIV